MTKTLPILVGLLVLLGTGVVHGLWTHRWQPSRALVEAEARLAGLPTTLGAWKSEAYEQDPEMLELSGAVAHYSRTFLDPLTGEKVVVILLAGLPSRMSVHRPEHCYQSVGYDMITPSVRATVQPKDYPAAEFFTAVFSRAEADGPNKLRIFWSFSTTGTWSAPTNPRFAFARESVLYKLYVVRDVSQATGPLTNDPCVRLLGELLPTLDRTLWPAE